MRRAVSILAVCALAASVPGGVESLRERSPFIPAAAVQDTSGGSALSGLELTGILSVGGNPQFSIRDTATGRSVWIGLGETQEELTVRNFDDASASVVIDGRGTSRVLVLREAQVSTAIPQPVVIRPLPIVTTSGMPPLPPASVTSPGYVPGVNPLPATQSKTVAEAERDARLLVSDLLEISILERRRHEEAARMANQAGPAPTP